MPQGLSRTATPLRLSASQRKREPRELAGIPMPMPLLTPEPPGPPGPPSGPGEAAGPCAPPCAGPMRATALAAVAAEAAATEARRRPLEAAAMYVDKNKKAKENAERAAKLETIRQIQKELFGHHKIDLFSEDK